MASDGALTKAWRSGLSGSMAMGVQVTTMMWLRTAVQYQYRHGGGGVAALRTLLREGGVRRLYRGYPWAMLQAPLSRFGDVASYTAAQQLDLPAWQSTGVASLGSSAWRLVLMPLDSLKTTMQVHGPQGWPLLRQKVRRSGAGVLYHGYLGTAGAGMLGYYPWFFTFGMLDRHLPAPGEGWLAPLLRHAVMGFGASAVSDTVSNSARVLKTFRQTHPEPISYLAAAKSIMGEGKDWRRLAGRGLRTKIAANGLQSATFAVAWKYLEKHVFAQATEPQ
jgi:hypothetical protein